MSKKPYIKIGGQRFALPDPWWLCGHPLRCAIVKQLVVNGHESLGASDPANERLEFVRDHASLEGFMSLAMHEALEYTNSSLECGLPHERIMQITEVLGPFAVAFFKEQLRAVDPEKPGPLAESRGN